MPEEDPLLPAPVAPMLATSGAPPVGPGWAVEFKWDGIRAVVAAAGGHVRLTSRLGNDVTGGYPELAALGRLAGGRPLVVDGEIVALGAGGRPDFHLLQQRMHLRSPADVQLMRERVPVSFYVFDLLHLDGESFLAEPYDVRRARLAELAGNAVEPPVFVPPSYPDVAPAQLLEVARQHRLEGVVAKRRTGRYEAGRRSPSWIKTALVQTQEVVIGGWTPGEGRRTRTLGSLLLGAHDDEGRLVYLGHVGTGFTEAVLGSLLARLRPLARPRSPFDEPVPRDHARKARWVDPVLVGQVEYRNLTHDDRLRHASWRGLRPDRTPTEVRLRRP